MNYSYIEQLIARYWEAETSREEEDILRAFFAQKDVPEHLQQYADYFSSLHSASTLTMSDDFEERILQKVEHDSPVQIVAARPLTLTDRLRPFFRAAAVVAIVAMVGGSVNRAISFNRADREARIAAQQLRNESIPAQLETLRDIQTGVQTATVDSSATILHY